MIPRNHITTSKEGGKFEQRPTNHLHFQPLKLTPDPRGTCPTKTASIIQFRCDCAPAHLPPPCLITGGDIKLRWPRLTERFLVTLSHPEAGNLVWAPHGKSPVRVRPRSAKRWACRTYGRSTLHFFALKRSVLLSWIVFYNFVGFGNIDSVLRVSDVRCSLYNIIYVILIMPLPLDERMFWNSQKIFL